jgi:capsular polysaccharide biosynthesis protein
MVTAPQPVQLTDMVGALRRNWHVVAATAVVGLLLGMAVSFALPSRYEATSTVSVAPMSADPVGSASDSTRSVSMPTEAGTVTSAQVAQAAAKALKPQYDISATDIRESTEVSSPEDSLILEIHFTGDSAGEAAAGADAVAEAYLMTRRADAAGEIERLTTSAQEQLGAVQASADLPENAGPLRQRALGVQADALGTKLAQLSNIDLTPGQIVGNAETPTSPSTPGIVPLGLAGLFLGLLAGIPFALLKKDENSDIGGVDSLHAIGDQIVLDGTKDTNRADTWDIAAFMLKIPADLGIEDPFLIMVDAEEEPGRAITPGQELVDALSRRGRSARFVDAGAINEGKISRGWPTEKKRISWAGEIIVIDTTHLSSDANKVALATRSDSVLLARSTTDDAAALRRLAGLLRSKGVDIALTALFPARSELVTLHR